MEYREPEIKITRTQCGTSFMASFFDSREAGVDVLHENTIDESEWY